MKVMFVLFFTNICPRFNNKIKIKNETGNSLVSFFGVYVSGILIILETILINYFCKPGILSVYLVKKIVELLYKYYVLFLIFFFVLLYFLIGDLCDVDEVFIKPHGVLLTSGLEVISLHGSDINLSKVLIGAACVTTAVTAAYIGYSVSSFNVYGNIDSRAFSNYVGWLADSTRGVDVQDNYTSMPLISNTNVLLFPMEINGTLSTSIISAPMPRIDIPVPLFQNPVINISTNETLGVKDTTAFADIKVIDDRNKVTKYAENDVEETIDLVKIQKDYVLLRDIAAYHLKEKLKYDLKHHKVLLICEEMEFSGYNKENRATLLEYEEIVTELGEIERCYSSEKKALEAVEPSVEQAKAKLRKYSPNDDELKKGSYRQRTKELDAISDETAVIKAKRDKRIADVFKIDLKDTNAIEEIKVRKKDLVTQRGEVRQKIRYDLAKAKAALGGVSPSLVELEERTVRIKETILHKIAEREKAEADALKIEVLAKLSKSDSVGFDFMQKRDNMEKLKKKLV